MTSEGARRRDAAAGLVVAVAGLAVLLQRLPLRFDRLADAPLLALVLPALGLLVGLGAVLRDDARWGTTSAALLLLGAAPLRLGIPGLLEWGLAVAVGAGIVLHVEALRLGDRAQNLRDRLDTVEEDGAATAEAITLRRQREGRRAILGASVLLLVALPAGRLLRFLLPGSLGGSLEVASVYGLVLFSFLAVGVVVGVTWVRRHRAGA